MLDDLVVNLIPHENEQLAVWPGGMVMVPLTARFSVSGLSLFVWTVELSPLGQTVCCLCIELDTGMSGFTRSSMVLPHEPLMLVPYGSRCLVLLTNHAPYEVYASGYTIERADKFYVASDGFIYYGTGIACCPSPFGACSAQWIQGVPLMRYTVLTDNHLSIFLTAS